MDIEFTRKKLKEYSFPSREKIFTFDFSAPVFDDGFNIVCAARQSEGARPVSLESFWPSALYSCIEDIFSNEDYEWLAESTEINELKELPFLEVIETVLGGTCFELQNIRNVYQLLDLESYKGFIGNDSNGVFAIILAKNV